MLGLRRQRAERIREEISGDVPGKAGDYFSIIDAGSVFTGADIPVIHKSILTIHVCFKRLTGVAPQTFRDKKIKPEFQKIFEEKVKKHVYLKK